MNTLSFKEFAPLLEVSLSTLFEENAGVLNEALIQLANQKDALFGNVIILAGGAGSGKGMVLNNLIDIKGKVFDVDVLKTMALKAPLLQTKLTDFFGKDVDYTAPDFLRNTENVSHLHEIISDVMNLPKRKENAFYKSVLTAAADRKPNIIFDVTLKDMNKLESITRQVKALGYDEKRIHIVWVLSEIEFAYKMNQQRNRIVSRDVFLSTHNGVSITMLQILNMGERLKQFMDGSIAIAFNKVDLSGVSDNQLVVGKKSNSENPVLASKNGSKGQYIEKSNYIFVKRTGKPQLTPEQLDKEILAKIKAYVPNLGHW